MKTIYFLRHAKSDWSDSTLSDHARPLNARGRRAAAKMGVLMQRLGVAPDLVLCSTAERAKETLERVMSAGGFDWTVKHERGLYGASADSILSIVRTQDCEHENLMFVGHNPGFEDIILGLSGAEETVGDLLRIKRKYPTAAFSVIDFDVDTFAQIGLGGGCLTQFIKPKDKTIV
ncbi:SixA phosphatase family protein [Kordiimonas aquimaris]|uniref:SixA phosphatase family protein n=1 Tax=Kordiimonas aquimaris TaxID=707591 RepID=UPI0021D355EE|nr:histidine phosphatase family protein [Kordiimonas aquimaris]